jgi:hypothetical protein
MNFITSVFEERKLGWFELELIFSIWSIATPGPNFVGSVDAYHKVHVTNNNFFNRLNFETKVYRSELLAFCHIFSLPKHAIRINSNCTEFIFPLNLLRNLLLRFFFIFNWLFLLYWLIFNDLFFTEKTENHLIMTINAISTPNTFCLELKVRFIDFYFFFSLFSRLFFLSSRINLLFWLGLDGLRFLRSWFALHKAFVELVIWFLLFKTTLDILLRLHRSCKSGILISLAYLLAFLLSEGLS